MGTRGRVRKVNVSTANIREVADIDYSIKQADTTGTELFADNDLLGEYIDPVYCEGNDNAERLAILTSKEYAIGEFRNYGGEGIPIEGEPEIYFNSILGKGYNDGNLIEFIPTLVEDLQYLIDNDLILGTAVPPNLDIVDDYTSQIIIASKMLVDATQSAMFRKGNDNVLNMSDLAIRVGLDYTDPASKDAVFSYNIEVYYGDIPGELKVDDAETPTTKKDKTLLNISYVVGAVGTLGYVSGRLGAAQFWDKLIGGLKPAWTKIRTGWRAIDRFATNTPLGTAITPILAALGSYTAMIMVANIIWDWTHNATKVIDGIYQYKNMIDGMYTWDDIKKTKYQIGFGRIFDGVDNFISKTISATDDQNVYTIPANDTLFPANDAGGRSKYANFKFFPKCNQYDPMTPPPIITFKIELEALSGCSLSITKPTVFTISVAPDKYLAPIFDVITPTGRASESIQNVYTNTPLVFENARFVDFIALLDLEASSGGSFGLLKTYEDRYINSDGADLYYHNKYVPISGNNASTVGGNIFRAFQQMQGPFELITYAEISTYDIKFIQEAQGNIIKNPTFRLEQLSGYQDDPTYLLRKFWNYDSSWEIRDGAIYRDSAGNQVDGFWQDVPALRFELHESIGQYYFLEIDCVISSGSHLDIELTNTFKGGLYRWYSDDPYSSHNSRERNLMNPIQYPEGTFGYNPEWPVGMSIINEFDINLGFYKALRITDSGVYKVLLRTSNTTRPVSVTNSIFKVIPSEDFTGRVNYVSLQFMPTLPVSSDKWDPNNRWATNALTEYNQPSLKLHWLNSIMIEKAVTLVFNISVPTTVHVKLTPKEDEAQYYTITALWQPNETADIYTDLSYQEYDIVHTYLIPGIYTATITCSIPSGDIGASYFNILFENFTCNQVELIKYSDTLGLTSGGTIDLSGSNIGQADRIIQLYYMVTDSFTSPLISLDVSNTPISGNCDKLIVISNYLDISHTRVSGDLTSLFHIAYVDASYSGIIVCSGVDVPTGTDGNKTIIWKNCGMNADQLYNLIHAIDVSNLEGGYLDIKGDNPIITDQDTLDTITMLTTNTGEPDGLGGIGRGWTILYNAVLGYTLTVNNGTISMPDNLLLTWDDVANVPVVDANSVSDWNIFFDLPTNGTPFTSVVVTGNEVNLIGGSGISIKDHLFYYNINIIKIIDNGCIIQINNLAFNSCISLTDISFPSCNRVVGIIDMEVGTFYGCTSLINVYIPLLTNIETSTFQRCSSVIEFNFPLLQSIEVSSFADCVSVTSFISPNLISAGNSCFSGCISVSEFDFPLFTSAGDYCFYGCTNLLTINLPNLITAGMFCFGYCSSLAILDFPLLTIAPDYCFDVLVGVTTINLPSLITAGMLCFDTCSLVSTANFNNLQTVGEGCFRGWVSLSSFNLPSLITLGTTTGNEYVFEDISGKTITLTIPSALMTCNSGNPDGDIAYLVANNTVTIIQI